VIAIASLAWALLMVNRASALNQEITNLQEKLASQEQLINNLQEQLVNEQQVIALISAPGTETFDITGTDLQPQARGRLFVKPNSQTGSLVLSGLTPLETGSVYQLWLIQGDLPVAAGVFTVDAQGQATLQLQAVQAISSYDALGVSVEPEGGSQQPTGDIVIFSALSKDA
ncbi:MAG TPA: anti-sigma factor, partial [Anaerolineales bacterium]|nr:anti-sigma factor [Anaerolineales bacterium]